MHRKSSILFCSVCVCVCVSEVGFINPRLDLYIATDIYKSEAVYINSSKDIIFEAGFIYRD